LAVSYPVSDGDVYMRAVIGGPDFRHVGLT
jgi:hypothetical protein